MSKYILLGCFLLFLISCSEKQVSRISDEQVVNILADMQVAESAVTLVNPIIKDSLLKSYKSELFAIHKVDSLEFRKHFEYLQTDPKRMTLLYEQVILRLDKLDSH